MRLLAMVGAIGLSLSVGCASPSVAPCDPDALGSVDGKADGPRTGTPQQRLDALVGLLEGGAQNIDLPARARQSDLSFDEGVSVSVTVVDAPDGIAALASEGTSRLINDFAGDARGGVSQLVENYTPFTVQYMGVSDYFLKTLVDRGVRAQVTDLLSDSDEGFRFSAYDDQSELIGTEYFVFVFDDLGKAVIFEMSYSEVY